MRMLLRVSIPVEAGNAAAKAGTLGSTIEKILADLKAACNPEDKEDSLTYLIADEQTIKTWLGYNNLDLATICPSP